jgi:hypothetical protein
MRELIPLSEESYRIPVPLLAANTTGSIRLCPSSERDQVTPDDAFLLEPFLPDHN